jgi:tetratricopeptide (TPR) repeat protein
MRLPLRHVVVAAALASAALAVWAECRLRRSADPPDESAWADSIRYLHRDVRIPFFRKDGASWVPARPRSTAKAFAAKKPAGRRRIFIVGESVAQRFTDAALASAFPPPVEVVNAGMGGYDSERVAGVLDDALEHEPDLVVVLAGNNDAPTAPVWYPAWRLNQTLRRLRLWRLAQDRLRPRATPAVVDRDRLDARFEANLRRMARAARAKHVPVVFCTLPVNERDWPPNGELPLGAPEFFDGWQALQEGKTKGAIAHLRRFTKDSPRDPMGHFWLGKALGSREEDLAALEMNWPDRCTPRRNDIIRRVAKEEGARLADLDAYVRARAPGGAPGWEAFLDGVHWRPEFDAPFSALIAGEAPGAPPAPPAGEAIKGYALHALSDAMQAQLENDPPILSEQAVAELQRARSLDPRELKRLLKSREAAAQALAENPWTAFLSARTPELWTGALVHAGEARWRDGARKEALALFHEAVERDPRSQLALLMLAKSELAAGELRPGRTHLDAIDPNSREATLAALYRARDWKAFGKREQRAR